MQCLCSGINRMKTIHHEEVSPPVEQCITQLVFMDNCFSILIESRLTYSFLSLIHAADQLINTHVFPV